MPETPIVNDKDGRINSILNDTDALFEIGGNPGANPVWHEGYAVETIGYGQTLRFDSIIESQAQDLGVNSDWVRAIMYLETSQGMVKEQGAALLGAFIKSPTSIMPMNINPTIWGGVGGVSAEAMYGAEGNIRAATALLRAIRDRLDPEDQTFEKIASIYNSIASDAVADYGARAKNILDNELWEMPPGYQYKSGIEEFVSDADEWLDETVEDAKERFEELLNLLNLDLILNRKPTAPPTDTDASNTGVPAVDDVTDNVENGEDDPSPLILDTDASGTIDLVSLSGADAVYFDLDNNGFAEATGWTAGADGFLALDLNQDGIINNGGELFGDQTGYGNGFLALAAYDSNIDGFISSEDQVWGDLRVWIDANHNGYSEEEELHTLDGVNITAIVLAYTEVDYDISGNNIRQEGTFTMSGNTYDIVDVYFETNPVNSVYDQEYTLDVNALFLPMLRGYGTLPDLHIAMSIDNDEEDSDSLISLVTDFSELTTAEMFSADDVAMDAVRDIMYRWAGVDEVNPTSRGPNVDAQELVFLEMMTGQPFLQQGYRSDPLPQAGDHLSEAFVLAHNHFFATLVAQTAAGELFTGDFYYNIATDSVDGITGLDTAVLDDLETAAALLSTTAEKEDLWINVVRMIEYTIGTDNLDGTSLTALEDAIDASGTDLAFLVDSLVEAPALNEVNGTSGVDDLDGTGGRDVIDGAGGNDTLDGLAGIDELYGRGGDDTLTGGGGDDFLSGGDGTDTYVYNLGDGLDVIDDDGSSAGDKILFGAGIDAGDLTFTRVGEMDLVIDIDTGSQTGQIIIANQFHSSDIIETIEFDDTSTIDLTTQVFAMNGTAGNDTLYGVTVGGSINDTIYAGDGDDKVYGLTGVDTLYGEAGNDQLFGAAGDDVLYGGDGNDLLDGGADNDTLHSGAGNDTANGASGNDSYHYTSGQDLYIEAGGTDQIYLASGYTSGSTIYYKINSDLQILLDVGDTITVSRFFDSSTYKIETLHFDGGPSVDLTSVSYTVQGGTGNDTLTGTSGADTFYGMGGDDILDGGSGNDTLYGGTGDDYIEGDNNDDYLDGGAGSDTLLGGSGNDTYVYVSGHDIFSDTGGTEVIQMAAGWTLGDLTFRRYSANDDHLVIEMSEANSISLNYQFLNSGRVFETIAFSDLSSYTLSTMVFETHGTSGNDVISGITVGGSTNDIIYGLDGADELYGSSGNDQLFGGEGNDELYGGNNDDYLSGGAGDDYIEGSSGNDTYYYESGLDTFREHSGTDKLIMGGGVTINDITTSQVGNDALIVVNSSVDELTVELQHYSSSYRIETIQFEDGFIASFTGHLSWTWGTTGVDSITGTGSNDTIIGKDGDDTISGAGGADNIHGGAGADTLHGGDSSDLLHGGLGDDILFGDAGADTIFGGAGADIFTFEAATAYSGVDLIKDFSAGEGDKIDLLDVLDGIYDPMSDDLLDFVQISESAGDTLLSIDRDGTGMTYGWTQIASIQGVTGLGDADAMVTAGQLLAA